MTKNSKLYFIDGWKFAVFIWDVYLTAALPGVCSAWHLKIIQVLILSLYSPKFFYFYR